MIAHIQGRYTFPHLKNNNQKTFSVGFISDTMKATVFTLCMIISLLGVYIVILGFDDLGFISRSQMCQKYKLQIVCFWILVLCRSMLCSCYIPKKIMHNIICVTGVYSREIISMFLVGQMSWHVKNFNIGIFSDTINVINVKLCMMILLMELYLLYLSLIHI